MMEDMQQQETWQQIREMLSSADPQRIEDYLEQIGPAETARALDHLDEEARNHVLTVIDPETAADILEDVSIEQAIELIHSLKPEEAAPILDDLPSDQQADLIGDLDEKEANAILEEMSPEEVKDIQELITYDPESVGGVMVKEYLVFGQNQLVNEIQEDLRKNREKYTEYDVQYIYVVDEGSSLVGVLRMRDLLFTTDYTPLRQVMIRSPYSIEAQASLEELQGFFNQRNLLGAPVVDETNRLVGVVNRTVLERATLKKADRAFLSFLGIVGGEELRSLPLRVRSGRRLSWLSINIVLNIIAASVIAMHEETIQAVVALAIFLPMISDMSGCSGNQAVAVSMRELVLGLIKPHEVLRVLVKESTLGVINGVALGTLIGLVAFFWKGNAYLGLIVGTALAANTVIAVSLGGLLPLILKRLKLDPALVSGPVLTTVTDMAGFFLLLSLASIALPKII